MTEGKALVVDLSKATSRVEPISAEIRGQYLGGRGLAAHLMFPWARPGVDPLGPENRLIFSVGPIQGTGISYETKSAVSTLSPLTGLYVFSVSGGQLGPVLGGSGYDALVIQGQASTPVYLWINDGKVEFREARHLWGMKTREIQQALLEEVEEEDAVTVVIGPAGENQVRYASIITERDKQRAYGRGGAGAVMGAKNLKGIVLKAEGYRRIARPGDYLEAAKAAAESVRKNLSWQKEWTAYGTRTGLEVLSACGILPTRNWWTGIYPEATEIAAYFKNDSPGRGIPCGDYCISPCSAISQVKSGHLKGQSCEGPEYETIYALGSNCVIDDPAALIAAQRICDDWGLDTISAGVAISFAMECYEKGFLTQKETEGIELKFGHSQAMLAMLDKIALRQGLGDLLAQGVKKAAEEVGHNSDFFAIHGKGLELGGYEVRISFGQALQFAFSPRGGCHHDLGLPARVEMYQGTGKEVKGKGKMVKGLALESATFDSSIFCSFSRRVLGMEIPGRLISAVWGEDVSPDDLRRIAERVLNLERVILARFGVRRSDDRLPERFTKEGYPDDPHKGWVVPLEELKSEFYDAFGWDQDTGLPTREKLVELGLAEAGRELYD